MDFYKEIYNKTTKIANCILGDYHTKETLRESIMLMIVFSCLRYQTDTEFKKTIDFINETKTIPRL